MKYTCFGFAICLLLSSCCKEDHTILLTEEENIFLSQSADTLLYINSNQDTNTFILTRNSVFTGYAPIRNRSGCSIIYQNRDFEYSSEDSFRILVVITRN